MHPTCPVLFYFQAEMEEREERKRMQELREQERRQEEERERLLEQKQVSQTPICIFVLPVFIWGETDAVLPLLFFF